MTDRSVRAVRWLRAAPIILLLSVVAATAWFLDRGYQVRVSHAGRDASLSAANRAVSGAGPAERTRWNDLYAQLPLSFESNDGQTDERVKFLSRGRDYELFLTGNEAVLEFANRQPKAKAQKSIATARNSRPERSGSVLELKLAGANAAPRMEGMDELPGKSNYFIGNKPSNWRPGVANYARVRYNNIYSNTDLVFYGHQRQLEYDFVAKPGADPHAIALQIRGADRASLDASGNLVVESSGTQMRFDRPSLYQEGSAGRITVQGGYVLGPSLGGIREVRFKVGTYDPSKTLVIDPSLTYSTYLGGSDNDQANGITVDTAGNAYVTGQTFSSNFPLQAPEQGTCPPASSTAVCGTSTGKSDVFVSKINSAGTALAYSTFIGGSFLDFGVSISVDPSGNAYVTGQTDSTDFPLKNAFQTTGNTLGDVFVTELNPAGSALVYSSYLGGTGTSLGQGIVADAAGNAYIVGTTTAADFPTVGAYQKTAQGGSDVFVAQIAPAGASLKYSTYLGGAGNDNGNGIAVAGGNVYITGQTQSNNFPTASAYQAAYGGQGDAFVAKLVLSGANVTLGYSTFLGGTSADEAWAIALDASSNVYVAGATTSTDFPSASPFQAALPGGTGSHAFVSKLDPTGTKLVYSTYLGGSGSDTARGISVDTSGVAHVVGYTTSTNFPTANPIQNTYAGNTDAFLTRINSMGCGLAFSTYLGGKATDEALAVRADSAGNSYLAGFTGSNDFPTASPFQSATRGNNDAIVAKVPAITAGNTCLAPTALVFPAQESLSASTAMNVTLTNDGNADLTISSIAVAGPFSQTNTCGSSVSMGQNCSISVVFNPTAAGPGTGSLTVTDNAAGASSATQTVALSGTGTDFGIEISPGSASISAGQSATFGVTIQPSSQFNQSITLTCNTTVLAGTCSITPGSITPSGGAAATASVTVNSTSGSAPPVGFGGPKPPFGWILALTSIGMILAGGWARRMQGRRALASFAVLALAMLLVMGWAGCGVNNSPPSHTPPGNYTVNVTATAGALVHSIRAQVTVQ